MADHERIWLQHPDDAIHNDEGRLWCEDKIWPDDDEDGEPTEYVRADLLAEARAQIAAKDIELAELKGQWERLLANYASADARAEAAEAQIAAKDAATLVDALVVLAQHNIPPDIQELLVSGDPVRGIAPGALEAAIAGAARETE